MAAKKRRKNILPYKYRGLVLDEFQREAIWYLDNKISTLVSAPTGTGKTLIADFLVEKTLGANQRLIYTAPIKALVNQKYREFCRRYGQKIGIVTGDVSYQQRAPIVVMTTEILRNMLIRGDRAVDTNWVVFDEIHYLNHPERGTVWEEAILFIPEDTLILGLSATIPNAQQLARWMEAIGRDVAVVQHRERAVPLRHMYFTKHRQAVERKDLLQAVAESPSIDADTKGGTLDWHELPINRRQQRRSLGAGATHLDLIHYAARNRLFPCLYFVFSREGCEEKAKELANTRDYLSAKEKEAVRVADHGSSSPAIPEGKGN